MMNSLFVLLLTLSMVGSIVFGMILILDYVWGNDYIEYMYFLMKFVMVIYLSAISVFVTVFININTDARVVSIGTVDFENAGLYLIKELKNFNTIIPDYIIGLLYIWIIVGIISVIVSIIKSNLSLRRIIKHSTRKDDWMLDLLVAMRDEMGIQKDITIYQSEALHSPFQVGIIHPKIIIPNLWMETEEWKMVLKHELIHYKNMDILYRSLITITQKIHWFNPVIYIFQKKFHDMSELLCDDRVLLDLNKNQRSQYAKLILTLTSGGSLDHTTLLADGEYQFLERRIAFIMKPNKRKITGAFIGSLVMFMLSCPLVTYASTKGSLYVQNQLVEKQQEKNRKLTSDESSNVAYEIVKTINPTVKTLDVLPRGLNQIDVTIPGNSELVFDSLSLNSGSKVRISLVSENATDKFNVGLLKDGKGTYYASKEGMVSGTFNVTTSGEYTVYIEGKNGNSKDMRITGTIDVKY